jgi:hypothetical protein
MWLQFLTLGLSNGLKTSLWRQVDKRRTLIVTRQMIRFRYTTSSVCQLDTLTSFDLLPRSAEEEGKQMPFQPMSNGQSNGQCLDRLVAQPGSHTSICQLDVLEEIFKVCNPV